MLHPRDSMGDAGIAAADLGVPLVLTDPDNEYPGHPSKYLSRPKGRTQTPIPLSWRERGEGEKSPNSSYECSFQRSMPGCTLLNPTICYHCYILYTCMFRALIPAWFASARARNSAFAH